jgi:hypothetical protein
MFTASTARQATLTKKESKPEDSFPTLEIARVRAHFVMQNYSFAQWARAHGYVYQTCRLACQGKRRSASARKIVEQLQKELAS